MDAKQYRALMESLALRGSKKDNDKRFKEITRRLGNMNFSFGSMEAPSQLMGLVEDGTMTLDDLVILGQFDKAITKQDTKAADFLRDTRGEKPSTQIEISEDRSSLSQLSDEQLKALADFLTGEISD